jgi:hypothetical protein
MKKRILDLGKKLVDELEGNDRYDTLTRWMAHYIGEQISYIEDSNGNNEDAKTKCFDTIMKLWEHRSVIPYEHRPFKNFDIIFRALERLNPENKDSYHRYAVLDQSSEAASTDTTEETKKWLGIALSIDRTTRVWIEHAIRQAASCALDDKTKMWLQSSVATDFNDDIRAISKLIRDIDTEDSRNKKEIKQQEIEAIKSRIKKLKLFAKYNKELLISYQEELHSIEKDA